MIPQLPCLHLARIAIETRTPLSVGTGRGTGLQDIELLRDANGLPTIPGTSIAGVLRHTYEHARRGEADALFGHGEKGRLEQPSHVHVSWGAIHNSTDRPVEGLKLGTEANKLQSDTILGIALRPAPGSRDHVRIDAHGVAAETAKFNRTVLPAGFRFSFELSLWSKSLEDSRYDKLLVLLRDPQFRLGGATRRGLGAIDARRVHFAAFDFRKSGDRRRFAALGDHLGDIDGLAERKPAATAEERRDSDAITATIELRPVDFWRIGQGKAPRAKTAAGGTPDLVPVRESKVAWETQANGSQKGSLGKRMLVVPASGLKGALRHRVAFHHARLAGRFAEDMSAEEISKWTEEGATAIRELFGIVKDSPDWREPRATRNGDRGQAGRVLLDDAWVEDQPGSVMPHNSIDRFTGGVRNGFLFTEELATQGVATVRLAVLAKGASAKAVEAFGWALDDLTRGRLAIGAGGAKGHGYCTGRITWSDDGAWIKGARP